MIGGSRLSNYGLILETYKSSKYCLDGYKFTLINESTLEIEHGDKKDVVEISYDNIIYKSKSRKIFNLGDFVIKFESITDFEHVQDDASIANILDECNGTLLHVKSVNVAIPDYRYQVSIMKRVTGGINKMKKILKDYDPLEIILIKLSILEVFTVSCSYLYFKGLYYIDTKPDNIFFNIDDNNLDILTADLGSICCTPDKMVGITYPFLEAQLDKESGKYFVDCMTNKPKQEDIVYGIYLLMLSLFINLNNFDQIYYHQTYKRFYHSYLVNMSIQQFNNVIDLLQSLTVKSSSLLLEYIDNRKVVRELFDVFDIKENKDSPNELIAKKELDAMYISILKCRLNVLSILYPKLNIKKMEKQLIEEYLEYTYVDDTWIMTSRR